MTAPRLTEAKLAELERLLGHEGNHRVLVLALLDAAPRLIAAARLANEQGEVLELTELRVTMMEGEFAAARAECGGDERPLHHVIHDLLAERDATIAQQAERIAELESVNKQLFEAEFPSDSALKFWRDERIAHEKQLGERDATIERLAKEKLGLLREVKEVHGLLRATMDTAALRLQDNADQEKELDGCKATIERLTAERDEARANYQFMVERAADEKLDGYRELGARAAAAENERDAARAALASAVALIDEMLAFTESMVADTETGNAWRARRDALAK